MKKTASQIESDVFGLLNSSSLKTTISGKIYKEGVRPIDAKTEDAVITFISGMDGQIQTGVLNVNVYIPGIDNGTNKGVLVKDVSRCTNIESVLNSIAHSLSISSEYKFQLDRIVQTFKVDEIEQYFVNCRLKFKRSTF